MTGSCRVHYKEPNSRLSTIIGDDHLLGCVGPPGNQTFTSEVLKPYTSCWVTCLSMVNQLSFLCPRLERRRGMTLVETRLVKKEVLIQGLRNFTPVRTDREWRKKYSWNIKNLRNSRRLRLSPRVNIMTKRTRGTNT